MTDRQTYEDANMSDPRGDDDGPIYDGFSSEEQPDVDLFAEDEPKDKPEANDADDGDDLDFSDVGDDPAPKVDMQAILDVPRQVKEQLDRHSETTTVSQEMADWQRKEREASDAGDVKAFREAVRQQAILEAKQARETEDAPKAEQKQQPKQQAVAAEAQVFLKANPWFDTDPVMRGAALAIEGQLAAEGYTGKALYSKLHKDIRKEFPGKFQSPATRAKTEGGGRKASNSGPGLDSLNAQERSACRDYAEDFADSRHKGDKKAAMAEWIKVYKGSKK